MFKYEPAFKGIPGEATFEMMGPSLNQVRQDLILAFHKDVENKIRQALIEMGWTPPQQESVNDTWGT